MIKTIIFDVGGTLVDGPDLFMTISDKIKKIYGLDVRNELIEEFEKYHVASEFYTVKNILDRITVRILKKRGINNPKIDSSEVYKDVFINKSTLFDESKDILDFLKKVGIYLMIVSDADSDVLVPELKKLGIYHYFDEIIISSDINCYKTSKRIVDYINPKIRTPKNQILFVGDTDTDMGAAKNLEVKSVFINRKNKEKKGDITINSLSELKKLVRF